MKETENFYVPNIDYCYTVSASLDGKEYIFSGYQKKRIYILIFSHKQYEGSINTVTCYPTQR